MYALLIVLVVLLAVALCVSLYYLMKFVKYSMLFEDSINESLDILDISYGNITKLIERPLLFDSPEIKYVLSELRNAQNSILIVANEMSLSDKKDNN